MHFHTTNISKANTFESPHYNARGCEWLLCRCEGVLSEFLHIVKQLQRCCGWLSSGCFMTKGHCTLEMFARRKINTTSRYDNHVTASEIVVCQKKIWIGFDFCVFASVASILRGVLTVQSHRTSKCQNPE